jgi:hypothetical protein
LKYQEHGKLLAAEIGLSVPPGAPHAPPASDPPELEPAPELELDPDEPPLLLVEPPELEPPPSPAPGPPFDCDEEPHAARTAHTETKTHRDDALAASLTTKGYRRAPPPNIGMDRRGETIHPQRKS